MKKLVLLAALAVLGATANAQLSGNLYLAQANDAGIGIVDQEFSDFPTFSTGAGNVVTFSSSVKLTDVQTRLLDSGTWVADKVNSARLTISKFGSAPSNQHTPGGASSGSDIVYDALITANQTNISNGLFNYVGDASGVPVLSAGTYFITMTGVAGFGAHGQAFHMESTDTSMDSWARNPGGGFGLAGGTSWFHTIDQAGWTKQISMGVNGQAVPEPASMAVLGLGALVALKRKRSK